MSKIMVEFDTKSKELLLSRDGVEINPMDLGLQEVSFYSSYDNKGKYNMRMAHMKEDEEEDVYTSTFISAGEIAGIIDYVNI